MVEYTSRIDTVCSALSDPVRRDILERTLQAQLTVNEIALEYDISLAAVSKHLSVLSEADLITRRKDGRYVFIAARPEGLDELRAYLDHYSSRSIDSVEREN